MTTRRGERRRPRPTMISLVAVAGLLAAACGSSDAADDEAETSSAPATEAAAEAPTDSEPPATDAAADEPTDSEPPATDAADEVPTDSEPPATDAPELVADDDAGLDFSTLEPPTGEPMIVGLVNTEGPAGLNFPEIRTVAAATVEYLNQHGGMGGRPIELETCIADSSPESSQACAQELAGKNVEMVFLGLDLFPDYPTYTASGIPVVGSIPLFPADYASDAMYMGGGNASVGALMAAAVIQFFEADDVAIISADNPGSNGSEAAAIAAFEAAGITYRSLKGSDNETDAGFQGLVREAISGDPQVLISLYGDAGCIGMMRGRAELGVDIPVLSASTCTNGEVLEAAGDAANGWFFAPGGDRADTVQTLAMKEAAAIDLGVDPADVVLSDLGLGSQGPIMLLTMAAAAHDLAASGGEITGKSVWEHARANESGELSIYPEGGPLQCGASADYPAVCGFSLFIGEYVGDGRVEIVEGFENISVLDFLP